MKIKEIGKIETVSVGTCKIEIIKHDGTRILTEQFVGNTRQCYSKGISIFPLSLFLTRVDVYYSELVTVNTAQSLAHNFIQTVVHDDNCTIINNELIKYEDIRSMRIVEIEDKIIVPSYCQITDSGGY